MPIVAIGGAALAIVLILILLAGERLYITPFQGIGNAGGTVGGLILKWFASGISWAVNAALDEIKAGVRGIEGIMLWPAHWAHAHVGAITGTLYKAYAVSRHIMVDIVPGAMSMVLGTARTWVINAEQALGARIDSVVSWASSQFNAVYHYVNAEISLAEGYTQHLVAQAEAYAAAGIAADAKYAEGLFTTAIGYTDAQIKALDGWVTGELGQTQAWAAGQITALQKYIAATQGQTIAWTQALVGAVAVDLANLKFECTDNLCANLGDAAKWLNALSSPLGIAALFAMVAEAAADPIGTAQVLDATLGPLAQGAAEGFAALAGV